ncbi:MAG: class I SAM-dependent methyltransferase [Bradymonadaceae bacterium]
MASVDYDDQKKYWEGMDKRRKAYHPVVKAFARPKLDFMLQHLDHGDRQLTMLEVGAGNGYFSHTFNDVFDLISLDFSANMLEMNPLPRAQKVVGDAEDLQFEDDSFDVVFCGNLLHHLEDPLIAVQEMRRVARKHVILIEPNVMNPLMFAFGLLKPEERGALKFTANYVRGLGIKAGMELRGFASQGSIVPNKVPIFLLPFLSRIDGVSRLGFYHVAIFDV